MKIVIGIVIGLVVGGGIFGGIEYKIQSDAQDAALQSAKQDRYNKIPAEYRKAMEVSDNAETFSTILEAHPNSFPPISVDQFKIIMEWCGDDDHATYLSNSDVRRDLKDHIIFDIQVASK